MLGMSNAAWDVGELWAPSSSREKSWNLPWNNLKKLETPKLNQYIGSHKFALSHSDGGVGHTVNLCQLQLNGKFLQNNLVFFMFFTEALKQCFLHCHMWELLLRITKHFLEHWFEKFIINRAFVWCSHFRKKCKKIDEPIRPISQGSFLCKQYLGEVKRTDRNFTVSTLNPTFNVTTTSKNGISPKKS